jgi:Na+/phosphate symporter
MLAIWKQLSRPRKAVVALVVALVALVVAIIVCLIVVSQLNTIASGFNLGVTGNATRTSMFTNTFNALNLLVILPVVIAAGAIITYLAGWGRGQGG